MSPKQSELLTAGQSAGELLEFVLAGVRWRFRWCPAGSFTMGSPSNEERRDEDETQHKVTLTQGFWMGETVVTQEQWEAVMDSNPSYSDGSNLPVENVSWDDCQEFMTKLNGWLAASRSNVNTNETLGIPADYRFSLPTEAQWEYACRAGSTTAYCFGNEIHSLADYAWYCDNADNKRHPVGTKQANAWGIYDMHGNVWEWCQDWYGQYKEGAVVDPTGTLSCSHRIYRGGGDYCGEWLCRSATRSGGEPEYLLSSLGLRVSVIPSSNVVVPSSYRTLFDNIFDAAETGTVQDITYFIDHGPGVYDRDGNDATPLHHAAQSNSNVDVMQVLINYGADVCAENDYGETPLHKAAAFNSESAVLVFLFDRGADVNAKDHSGAMPLHYAAVNNSHIDVMQVLLDHGADVNAKEDCGATPLHSAAEYNTEPAVVQCLLDHGADVNAKDKTGRTPFDVALPENREMIQKAMSQAKGD